MKSLRKLLVAAIVTAMVLGTVGTSFAAVRTPNMVFGDVEGHPKASFILKTAALGIFDGYPMEDGTFEYRPDQVVSRAEFAKVVVAMLGRTAAAEIMKGTPTQFPDVTIDHWASGFINVATALGIIRGFPDGTFHPNGQVTMAEAITMLIRAMGYNPMAEAMASWPTGEILTASSMRTSPTTSVSILSTGFVAGTGCNRADVAEMVFKAMPVLFLTGKDANNNWVYGTETLLAKVGGEKIGAEVVQYAVQAGKTWLIIPSEAAPVEIAANAILVGAASFPELNERKVAFIKKGGKVIFAELLADTQLVRGDFTAFNSTDNKVTVGGTVYQFAAAFTLRRNGSTVADMPSVFGGITAENFFKLDPKPSATLILDTMGKITVMDVFVYNASGTITNKTTTFVANQIKNWIELNGAPPNWEIKADASIVRNGQTATFADLKLGDQVKVALDDSTPALVVAIDAINMVVEGYVTQASYDMASGLGMIMLDADKIVYMPTTGSATYQRWGQIFDTDLLLKNAADLSVPATISSATVANVRLGDRMEVTLDRNGRAFALKAWERKVTGTVTAKVTTAPGKISIDGVEYLVVADATDNSYSFDGKKWTSAVFLTALTVGDNIQVALNQAGAIRMAAVPVAMGEVTAFTVGGTTITVEGSVAATPVTYTLATGFKVMEGGVEVAASKVTVGANVRLTFDATNKVSVITLAGIEFTTIVNKRVYIQAGEIVYDIVLSDGRTVKVNDVLAYTLNGGAFDTAANGFNAMAVNDMAVITYNVQGKATGIDLFRSVAGKISAIVDAGDNVALSIVHPTTVWTIPGWDGNSGFTVWVKKTGTGATSLMRNGRTVTHTALAVGDSVTFAWAGTATPVAPLVSSLVAKWLPLDGAVVAKSVTYVGGNLVTILQVAVDSVVYEVTVGANPIVIKNGATSTADDIAIGDKVKCNFTATTPFVGTADYFEVTTP